MDEQERAAGRVPALVVEHDGEDGDVVAAGDPEDGAGDREEEGAVAYDGDDEGRGLIWGGGLEGGGLGGQFDAERGAAGPA